MHLLHCMFFEKVSHTPLNAIKMRCSFLVSFFSRKSMVAERAQCTAKKKKNTFKLRKLLHQFDNICAANAHNTANQRKALQIIRFIWLCCKHLQRVSLFVCVVSICSACCQIDEDVFLILLVLFLFACVFWSCSALSSISDTLKIMWFLCDLKNICDLHFPIFFKRTERDTVSLYTHCVFPLLPSQLANTFHLHALRAYCHGAQRSTGIAEYRRICN